MPAGTGVRRRLTETDKRLMHRWRAEGATYLQIANVIGISLNSVAYQLSPSHKANSLEAHQRYRKNHPEVERQWNEDNRDHLRAYSRYYLGGREKKVLKHPKRLYPNRCELCDGPPNKLHYHHWDDARPHMGMWICGNCHFTTAGPLEDPEFWMIVNVYSTLKVLVPLRELPPAPNYTSVRDYWRQTRLRSGKCLYIGLNKRRHPPENVCEICGGKVNILQYHHWNDENPSLGLWVCPNCHRIVELAENPNLLQIARRYISLRRLIEEEARCQEKDND